jgi:hypothetical protein
MSKDRMVIWRGASKLDGVTPIVVLATYDTRATGNSNNSKTGDMIQTWILRDDIEPHTALSEGRDEAICGTCQHRSPASGGSGACYVTVFRAPLSVWRAYKRGDARDFDLDVFRGNRVRFGAYGDPAAAPFEVWQAIADVAHGVTGYTHAWRDCDVRFSRYCMASADSLAEYRAARRGGYRTFLVRPMGSPKPPGLVPCPASDEAGKRTTCAVCLQCGGTSSGRRADITIAAHGATAKRFAATDEWALPVLLPICEF